MFPFEATLTGYAQTISESFCAGTKIIPDFCSDIGAFSATDRWSEAMRTVLESGASHIE